jgi:hypothetical protein
VGARECRSGRSAVVRRDELTTLAFRRRSRSLRAIRRGSRTSSDAGARGWTVDPSARICTRERRPLSCGAPSRAASSGCPTRTRRIRQSLVGRRESLVSAGSGLRTTLRRAAGAAAARARAFDLCCDPAGPLAFRPGRPRPSSADRAETDLVAVEIAIRRATGARAWGSRWSRSSSSPRAEESSSARAAAPPGRPTAPGAAACPG